VTWGKSIITKRTALPANNVRDPREKGAEFRGPKNASGGDMVVLKGLFNVRVMTAIGGWAPEKDKAGIVRDQG
jgi:hypothetical protein